jgi:hypothetical protein
VPFTGVINFMLIGGSTAFTAGDQFTFDAAYYDGAFWKVVAIGPWSFSVQQIQPVIGPIYYASFKVPFNNGQIAFLITNAWSEFYMTPDSNAYNAAGEDYFDNMYYDGPADGTDYLVNLALETQHGVVTDPNPSYSYEWLNGTTVETQTGEHFPVNLIPFGTLQLVNELDVNGNIVYQNGIPQQYYSFTVGTNDPLDTATPYLGTYIELRVEQNTQYNPRAGAVMSDSFITVDLGVPPGYTPAPTDFISPPPAPGPTPAPNPGPTETETTVPGQ